MYIYIYIHSIHSMCAVTLSPKATSELPKPAGSGDLHPEQWTSAARAAPHGRGWMWLGRRSKALVPMESRVRLQWYIWSR